MQKLSRLFWKYVVVSGLDECWLWVGAVQPNGYGKFGSGTVYTGTSLPHRVCYLLTRAVLNKTLHVCHSCDNALCVNPTHLFIGTSQENENDKWAKNRGIAGELHGNAKLKEADILAIRASGKPYSAIASKFGVSIMQVSNIKANIVWQHVGGVTNPKRSRNKISELQVADILASTLSGRQLASIYGVTDQTIYRIKNKAPKI